MQPLLRHGHGARGWQLSRGAEFGKEGVVVRWLSWYMLR